MAGCETEVEGARVSGSVARLAAAGSVGRYSGPFWPQPAAAAAMQAASTTRGRALTRICGTPIIREL